MRPAVVLLLVLLTACGSSSAAAVRSPSTSASPSASTSASSSAVSSSPPPAPSPSGPRVFQLPAPVVPPAAPGGYCDLPVYWPAPGNNGSMQAGFVRYPGGTPAGPVQTIGSTGTAFYDLAVNRWLPVPSEAVSPDGLRFAYAD